MASTPTGSVPPPTGGEILRRYIETWFRIERQVVPNPFGGEDPMPPMGRLSRYLDEALLLRSGSPVDTFFRGVEPRCMELWGLEADEFRSEVSRTWQTIRDLAQTPGSTEKAARPRGGRRVTMTGLGVPFAKNSGALVGSPTVAITTRAREATIVQLIGELDQIARTKVSWLRITAGRLPSVLDYTDPSAVKAAVKAIFDATARKSFGVTPYVALITAGTAALGGALWCLGSSSSQSAAG